jgi:hypothetical protein
MFVILIVTCFLAVLLWGLLRLREIRESAIEDVEGIDKTQILMGLFFTVSNACIKYYRDRGNYPQFITGDPEGLIELGYFEDELLAKQSSAIKLFSIVISDKNAVGVCLPHTTEDIANKLIRRARAADVLFNFVDFVRGEFEQLETPVSPLTLNLTFPLPFTPYDDDPTLP